MLQQASLRRPQCRNRGRPTARHAALLHRMTDRSPLSLPSWIRARPRASLLALALLPLPFVLGSCDNPSCVFGGICGGGGGNPSGAAAAGTIAVGDYIRNGAPSITSVFPQGLDAHSDSVIVLEVSESLNAGSLFNAFEVVESLQGVAVPILQQPALVGDGRLVILVPLAGLVEGMSYIVRFTEGAQVADLTGQVIAQGLNPDIGSFSVSNTPPDEPRVVATWPPADAARISDLTEIAVVFDRKMKAGSFNNDSWVVTVDGLEPLENPSPFPLIALGGVFPVTVDQVFRWRSVDGDGVPVSLGEGGAVELVLSPEGDELEAQDKTFLPTETIEFELLPFSVPALVFKHLLSEPEDAIGGPNLLGGGDVVQIELLEPSADGDSLEVFLVGGDPSFSGMGAAPLIALARTVSIPGGATTLFLDGDDLDLLAETSPLEGRLTGGPIQIAVMLERGNDRSAVQLFDADLDGEPGPQSVIFDVTAPRVLGLSTSGSVTATFVSDVRDLVIVGRASEELRRVEVVTLASGDNGLFPPVVSSDSDGLFVAAPVPVGLVDPGAGPIQYTIQVYDRALNPATSTVMGDFTQIGVVASTPIGGTLEVDVFDATTLALMPGANVMVHEDNGGTISVVGAVLTDAAGHATITGIGGGDVIVTVDLVGFDLFTFDDVPGKQFQVPLQPTGLGNALVEGDVLAAFTANISGATNRIADTRLSDPGDAFYPVDNCTVDMSTVPPGFRCGYGPEVVLPRRLGARTFVSADFAQTLFTFNPTVFLKAIDIGLPMAPIGPGDTEDEDIDVENLLIFLGQDEQAKDGPTITLDPAAAVNLGPLAGDPGVAIQGVSPGTVGAVTVGIGLAFDDVPGLWTVRGAYAGVADPVTGELVREGTIEADLLLRTELVDVDGARSGRRPRFSDLPPLGTDLRPPPVPVQRAPAPGAGSGGSTYNVVFDDVILDATGEDGLYRVELTDTTGRSWQLWTPDRAGGGGSDRAKVLVPDIGPLGGNPLANGPITARISAYAWASLDIGGAGFLWTDVEREYDVFSHTFPVTFSQP